MIVYTGGTFDLFHAGHVRFLERCAEFGRVVVALNTDEFVAAYKGDPPVCTFSEREAVLQACRHVDQVVANESGADSRPTIDRVAPDLIVIGSDWAVRDYHRQMGFDQPWLDARGIGLAYIPYTAGVSTTFIKRRIEAKVAGC